MVTGQEGKATLILRKQLIYCIHEHRCVVSGGSVHLIVLSLTDSVDIWTVTSACGDLKTTLIGIPTLWESNPASSICVFGPALSLLIRNEYFVAHLDYKAPASRHLPTGTALDAVLRRR